MSWLATHRKMLATQTTELPGKRARAYQKWLVSASRIFSSKSARVKPLRTFLAGTRPGLLRPGTCGGNTHESVRATASEKRDIWVHARKRAQEGVPSRLRQPAVPRRQSGAVRGVALTAMALAAAGTAKMAAKAARREKPSADICGEETRCGAATGEKLATGEKADADAAKVARMMRAVIEISSRSQRFRV